MRNAQGINNRGPLIAGKTSIYVKIDWLIN